MVPVSTCSDRGDILIGLLQGEQNIHSFPAIFNLLEQGWDVPVGIRTRDNIDKLLFFNNLIPHALCHAAAHANCQMSFFSFEGTELYEPVPYPRASTFLARRRTNARAHRR